MGVPSQKPSQSKAGHVAIIMDGNRRWAKARGLPGVLGHKAGARRLREIAEICPQHGIAYLTVFAFSTENWKRPKDEVSGLMTLFCNYIRQTLNEINKYGLCVRFIGERSGLDTELQSLMRSLEEQSKGKTRLTLTVALNYGGRDEVVRAMRRIADEVLKGNIELASIDETKIGSFLDTGHLPDPDLIIRTSGESRISNFLLWQSAYTEYEFVDTLWPDFTAEHFSEIVNQFSNRRRCFGAA